MIYLINEENKQVFYKIKNNIVGGPSIVDHRYHKKGITNIDRLFIIKKQKNGIITMMEKLWIEFWGTTQMPCIFIV